jgi:hypothetical protein
MNPMIPPAGGKSLIVPTTGGERGPVMVLLRFVPIPELRQATGDPGATAGDQSITEKLTVTPPPAQLATDRCPMIDAEAEGAHRATTAKLKSPNFRP